MMPPQLKDMRQARTFLGARAICKELFLLPRCLSDPYLNLGHICWFLLKAMGDFLLWKGMKRHSCTHRPIGNMRKRSYSARWKGFACILVFKYPLGELQDIITMWSRKAVFLLLCPQHNSYLSQLSDTLQRLVCIN